MNYAYMILIIIFGLLTIYSLFQLIRNEMVFRIRMRWIEQGNYKKWFSISYDAMMKPCWKNWFGLKLPKDKDY